jgi:hypothetical protein
MPWPAASCLLPRILRPLLGLPTNPQLSNSNPPTAPPASPAALQVLDLPLFELEQLKTIRVSFHNGKAELVETFQLRIPKVRAGPRAGGARAGAGAGCLRWRWCCWCCRCWPWCWPLVLWQRRCHATGPSCAAVGSAEAVPHVHRPAPPAHAPCRPCTAALPGKGRCPRRWAQWQTCCRSFRKSCRRNTRGSRSGGRSCLPACAFCQLPSAPNELRWGAAPPKTPHCYPEPRLQTASQSQESSPPPFRLLEVYQNKIFKVCAPDEAIDNYNDSYWSFRAEAAPADQQQEQAGSRLLSCYHFQVRSRAAGRRPQADSASRCTATHHAPPAARLACDRPSSSAQRAAGAPCAPPPPSLKTTPLHSLLLLAPRPPPPPFLISSFSSSTHPPTLSRRSWTRTAAARRPSATRSSWQSVSSGRRRPPAPSSLLHLLQRRPTSLAMLCSAPAPAPAPPPSHRTAPHPTPPCRRGGDTCGGQGAHPGQAGRGAGGVCQVEVCLHGRADVRQARVPGRRGRAEQVGGWAGIGWAGLGRAPGLVADSGRVVCG